MIFTVTCPKLCLFWCNTITLSNWGSSPNSKVFGVASTNTMFWHLMVSPMSLETLGKYSILFWSGKNNLSYLGCLCQDKEFGLSFSHPSITNFTCILIKSSVTCICHTDFFFPRRTTEVKLWGTYCSWTSPSRIINMLTLGSYCSHTHNECSPSGRSDHLTTYPIDDKVLRGKVIGKISINSSAGEQMWQKLESTGQNQEGIFIPFPKATLLKV